MKEKSIKKNAILNVIKTLMGFLFPLITFPYASRVLGPNGVGQVNFATSIISYFALIASLGINSYGVREGAKVRNSREKLSRLTKELFTINICSTIIAYSLLFVSLLIVSKFEDYRNLLIVCSASILFTTLGMEWLYTAVEDFTYITIRSILFQFISLVLLFAFVHSSEDIEIYAAISVFASVGANILNFIHARKYISLRNIKIKLKDLRKHIKPVFILFAMVITSSIYTMLDTSMLGFLASDFEIGIYTAATKINRIVLSLVVSVGGVLLPRLSYYLGTNDKENFGKLAYKSCDLILCIAMPAAVGLCVLAKDVILLLSGEEFLSAVSVMRIINPIIVIVGLSNFFGVQLFMTMQKEKWTLYSDIFGAVINITLNYFLIQRWGALGAAIASLCAEATVTGTQIFLAKRIFDLKPIFKSLICYLGLSIVMGGSVFVTRMLIQSDIIGMICGIIVGIGVYAILLLITGNQWAVMGIDMIKKKIK